MENLKSFAMDVLFVTEFVELLNGTYDKGELRIDDLYNVSTDKTDEHRIITIYETLGGTCLVSVKYDIETGEMSMTDHNYVYDRFGDYAEVAGMKLLGSEDEIDLSLFITSAYIAAILFAGSEKAMKEFRKLSKKVLN